MRIVLLIVLALVISPYAYACRITQLLSEEQKNMADIVFVGRATAYQPGQPATIRFNVEKVLKGKPDAVGDMLEVYWRNGNFGEPDSLDDFRKAYGVRSKVGIILPQTYNARRTCENVTAYNGLGEAGAMTSCSTGGLPLAFVPDKDFRFDDKPWVIGDWCSETFIAPAD
jgi:hypothetical protein